MRLAILYNQFLDNSGQHQSIGGVETYLLNLARLCNEINIEPTIYQCSKVAFEKIFYDFKVKGVPIVNLSPKNRNSALFRAAEMEINREIDMLIFGADNMSVPTKNKRYISIQHGVGWDLPIQDITKRKVLRRGFAAQIWKWLAIMRAKSYFENCSNTVCVDYNFLNWYRTITTKELTNHRVWVIPNFSYLATPKQIATRNYKNRDIKILFARRFVKIRGTHLIVEVVRKLLIKYFHITFTIAGEGPDESFLKTAFSNEKRVKFTKFSSSETLSVHLAHDIAIIPSIASEGSSLSVAEAMATACPVVATAVGGITNMIIDGYNGLLVMPNVSSLQEAIETLILNPNRRQALGMCAYETAKEAFSIEKWKQSWKAVLGEVTGRD